MANWYFRNRQSGLVSCPGCRNLVRTGQEFCPYCAKRLKVTDGIRHWYRRMLTRQDLATRILIGTIVAVFFLQLLADMFLPVQYRNAHGSSFFNMLTSYNVTYIRMGSNFQPFVAAYGEYWRLLTYCFLHFGLIHVVFNCIAFWDLGRLAERLWGARQVFATFIITGFFGGLASFLWNISVSFPKHSAGASGAVCGVLGLFLGAYYCNRQYIGEHLGSQLTRWAVYILVFGVIMRADNAAHIGGMIPGLIMGYYLPPTNHSRTLKRDARIWDIAALVSLVALVTSVIFAAVFFLRGPEYVMQLFSTLA